MLAQIDKFFAINALFNLTPAAFVLIGSGRLAEEKARRTNFSPD